MENHHLGPREDDPGYWDGLQPQSPCPGCGELEDCQCEPEKPMGMAKWTAGPWVVRGRVNEPTADVLRSVPDEQWGKVIWMPRPQFVFGQVGALVCTADKRSAETDANARLIAKAPEMYSQLNRVRGAIKCFWNGAIRDELLAEIEALLASARGEA